MKKEFSIKWISSRQPRKQRKYRYNAPMHVRQRLVSAHLEKALRKEYNKRTLTVRKGDEVKIMRGQFRGTRGKISKVDMKRLNFDDKKRRKFLARKPKKEEKKGEAKETKKK